MRLTSDTNLLIEYLKSFDSESTKRSYRSDLVHFFDTDIITQRASLEVSSDYVNEYFSKAIEQRELKPATLNRKLWALRGFFAWLISNGLLEQSPVAVALHRNFPRSAPGSREITVLTIREVEILLEAIDTNSISYVRNKTLLLVLLHCALRRSEACVMDFEHLKCVDRYWVLDLPYSKSTKCGPHQYVKVPERVAKAILVHREHYEYSSGAIWRSMSRNSLGRRLSTTSIYSIVRKTAERAGLGEGITPQSLRYASFNLALESGASLLQMCEHAGRNNVESTVWSSMISVTKPGRPSDSAADYIDVSSRDQNSPQSGE